MSRPPNGQVRRRRSATRTKLQPGHGYLNPRPGLPHRDLLPTKPRPVWPCIAAGIVIAIVIALAVYPG